MTSRLITALALVLMMSLIGVNLPHLTRPAAVSGETILAPPPIADLGVSLVNPPAQVRYRDELAYNIQVGNAGPDTAREVGLWVFLPGEFRLSEPVLGASSWSCGTVDSQRSPKVYCTLPSLGPGAVSQLALSFRVLNVPVGSTARIRLMVGSGVFDTNWSNDIYEFVSQFVP